MPGKVKPFEGGSRAAALALALPFKTGEKRKKKKKRGVTRKEALEGDSSWIAGGIARAFGK